MSNQIYRVSYLKDYSLNTLYFKANNKAEAKEEFLKKYTNLKESQIIGIEALDNKENSSIDFSSYFKQIASDKAIRTFAIVGLLLAGAYFGAKMYGEYKRQKLVAEFEEEHKEIAPNEIPQRNKEEEEPTPLNNPSHFTNDNPRVEFNAKSPNLNIASNSKNRNSSTRNQSSAYDKRTTQNLPKTLSNDKIKIDANYKTIGNRVHFKITASNTFINAKGGISVSIPSLRYDKDIYTINQSGFDNAKIYPSGSSLWSGSLKRKITSSYVLIEGWSNKWHRDTQKSLEFSIDKDLIANKSVFIRAVLVKNRQEYLLPTSGATDQQGYPVKQITVNVANNSNQANNENRQNYESAQSSDKIALKKVLNSWNRAMNNKDTSLLEYLLANKLKYYGTQYSRTKTIKDKQKILAKYPEFSQRIKNISYEEITQNLCKVSFDKYVKASYSSEEKLYPSYLYIKKINGEWKIVEESDKVTDRILHERSSNNANKGLFVCYDKKEVTASGVQYIGCQRRTLPCGSIKKLQFGMYPSNNETQNALNRCKSSKPKFIDSGKRASVGDGNFYIARISRKDHYNKWGKKLTKVADILQQDRANFYKFNKNDIEDFADAHFLKKENRFKIRKMLKNGYISSKTAYQIINGTPLVKVEINRNSINVSLYGKNKNKNVQKINNIKTINKPKNQHKVKIIDRRIQKKYLEYLKKFKEAKNNAKKAWPLSELAKLAFELKKYKEAKKYATQLLRIGYKYRNTWIYGNAIYDGNMVLGRLALLNNDAKSAKRYLYLSGKTPGSPTLDSFGPNMSLANDLLEKGYRKPVIKFLKQCERFWNFKTNIYKWIREIKRGNIPDFGANLVY